MAIIRNNFALFTNTLMPRKARQIALAFPIGTPYLEGVVRGVMEHARRRGPWHFAFSPDAGSVPIQSLRDWGGDGVISWLTSKRDIRTAAGLKQPVINLSAQLKDTGLPTVTPDHHAAGRLAGEHLIDRRFRRFGFYGLRDTHYSDLRLEGFRRTAGSDVSICLADNTVSAREPWRWDRRQLERWLKSLKPPVGILAAHDYRARAVLVAAERVGLRVPEDVAVVGVNNDAVTCEFCKPSLSSVAVDAVEVGRRAAQLLDRLMRGRPAPAQPVLVSPAGLIERASTRTVAVDDPRVGAAAQYLFDNAHQRIGVEDAAAHAGVSRRLLEMRFREMLDCTPHEHLTRRRIELVKAALEDPKRPKLIEVAHRSGFADTRRLKAVFTQHVGRTPRQYRASHQESSSVNRPSLAPNDSASTP